MQTSINKDTKKVTEKGTIYYSLFSRYTTLRQQLFLSLLDISETISLIVGSVNLDDVENKAVFPNFHHEK